MEISDIVVYHQGPPLNSDAITLIHNGIAFESRLELATLITKAIILYINRPEIPEGERAFDYVQGFLQPYFEKT